MRKAIPFLLASALILGIASPANAATAQFHGCAPALNPTVCLTINGQGLHVDSFAVSIFANNGQTYGKFMVRQGSTNGAIIKISKATNIPFYDDVTKVFTSGANFPNNTVICAEFSYISGEHDYSPLRPCGTIHS